MNDKTPHTSVRSLAVSNQRLFRSFFRLSSGGTVIPENQGVGARRVSLAASYETQNEKDVDDQLDYVRDVIMADSRQALIAQADPKRASALRLDTFTALA
jgi:hypothetical protein